MIISLGLGAVLMLLAGMDLQRILEEGSSTPKYVYAAFTITLLLGIFNLISAVGAK